MEFVQCPHCKGTVEVAEVNCAIFRHGILKRTGNQMDPHTPKKQCDELFTLDRIWGCGKPFKVIQWPDGSLIAVKCEYI